MDTLIGRCGIACGLCRHFNNQCLGCEEENRAAHICLIFNCAEKKDIKYCIMCPETPCKLMRGLSKSYCPVYCDYTLKDMPEKGERQQRLDQAYP